MKKLSITKKTIFFAAMVMVFSMPILVNAEIFGGDSDGGSFGGDTGGGSFGGDFGGGSFGGDSGGGSFGGDSGGGSFGGDTGGGSFGGDIGGGTFGTPYSYPTSYPSYSYPTGYSSGCSSCGYSYKPSTYSYTPSASYTYVPASTKSASVSSYNYVSNTNTAAASNSNTIANNPVNVFNPTNNNDARINLVVLGGGTSQPTQQALDGSCTISPGTAYVGQDLSFFANATGGNGNYTYNWSGDNGLYATAAAFTGKFMYAGTKTATVVITSNGQSITRTCSIDVQGGSSIQSNIQDGTPVSGVFLNEVPETGINLSLKMTLFTVGILLWSLFAAYIINAKRSKTLALATNTDVASRIEAFKQRNLARKN